MLFFGCSKSIIPSTITSSEATDAISPNMLQGPCPYLCTDTRCKGYLNGYCGVPVNLILKGDSTSAVSSSMTNVFNSLTNVNFVELKSELGLSSTLNASAIDLKGALLAYDSNNDSLSGQALVCNFYQNVSSKTTNYAFAYLWNGSSGEPVFIKVVTGNYFIIYI
jgi:hypothetical protein